MGATGQMSSIPEPELTGSAVEMDDVSERSLSSEYETDLWNTGCSNGILLAGSGSEQFSTLEPASGRVTGRVSRSRLLLGRAGRLDGERRTIACLGTWSVKSWRRRCMVDKDENKRNVRSLTDESSHLDGESSTGALPPQHGRLHSRREHARDQEPSRRSGTSSLRHDGVSCGGEAEDG